MDSVDLQVLRSSVAWLGEGHRVVLATIVETWGSSPRPAGAMLAGVETAWWPARFRAVAWKTI